MKQTFWESSLVLTWCKWLQMSPISFSSIWFSCCEAVLATVHEWSMGKDRWGLPSSVLRQCANRVNLSKQYFSFSRSLPFPFKFLTSAESFRRSHNLIFFQLANTVFFHQKCSWCWSRKSGKHYPHPMFFNFNMGISLTPASIKCSQMPFVKNIISNFPQCENAEETPHHKPRIFFPLIMCTGKEIQRIIIRVITFYFVDVPQK